VHWKAQFIKIFLHDDAEMFGIVKRKGQMICGKKGLEIWTDFPSSDACRCWVSVFKVSAGHYSKGLQGQGQRSINYNGTPC